MVEGSLPGDESFAGGRGGGDRGDAAGVLEAAPVAGRAIPIRHVCARVLSAVRDGNGVRDRRGGLERSQGKVSGLCIQHDFTEARLE